MDLWEYRTVYASWNARESNWRVTFTDSTTLVGLDTILNYEGARGWELISVLVEDTQGMSGNNASARASGVRMIYKRFKE